MPSGALRASCTSTIFGLCSFFEIVGGRFSICLRGFVILDIKKWAELREG